VSAIETCAVCGRTILAGERTRIYLTPDGEPHDVCELCRGRAEHYGWIWEELASQREPEAPRRRNRRLSALLRREGRRAQEPVDEEDEAEEEAEAVEPVEEEPEEARPRQRPSPDPAAPGAQVRARVPDSPHARQEHAIERFNESEEARTVAGLMRTLGPPWISVGAAAQSSSEVRITVAWELSWYQWGVDLRDELRPVYQIAKGHELSELDAAAQQWNAMAAEGGKLMLGLPPGWGDADKAEPLAG
jgi:hypothetical protein